MLEGCYYQKFKAFTQQNKEIVHKSYYILVQGFP